jgi:hypothetical protein
MARDLRISPSKSNCLSSVYTAIYALSFNSRTRDSSVSSKTGRLPKAKVDKDLNIVCRIDLAAPKLSPKVPRNVRAIG